MARPPASLNDFIGQRRVIARLRKLVAGARQRGDAMESLLLLGPPGMGKTALGEAITREYSGQRQGELKTFVRLLGGPRITGVLVEKLGALQHGDVLFIDEVHGLDREAQEVLHIALDERRTLGLREDGRLDRGTTRSIAEFTLVGASTEPGKLTTALRSRLREVILDPYEPDELKAIAESAGKALGLELTPQAARHLAERSQRTPRSIERLLKELSVTRSSRTVDRAAVRAFLEEAGIDEHGLNRFQQQYVQLLGAAGRPVSLTVARSRLGIDKGYIQSDIEPHLLHLGVIDIGPAGRTLTENGRAVAAEMARRATSPQPNEQDKTGGAQDEESLLPGEPKP